MLYQSTGGVITYILEIANGRLVTHPLSKLYKGYYFTGPDYNNQKSFYEIYTNINYVNKIDKIILSNKNLISPYGYVALSTCSSKVVLVVGMSSYPNLLKTIIIFSNQSYDKIGSEWPMVESMLERAPDNFEIEFKPPPIYA